ncbi:hypothetical protein ABEB36_002425 [Hypothenemus hampei]|uniref:Peptide-N(4)-(N-acetyl-beta-glucosaminyl)asparagine amidase n=1 Tax=Hypothenemus hampei TaxID=57062 RepID=A0ABD1F9D5_HYPHA
MDIDLLIKKLNENLNATTFRAVTSLIKILSYVQEHDNVSEVFFNKTNDDMQMIVKSTLGLRILEQLGFSEQDEFYVYPIYACRDVLNDVKHALVLWKTTAIQNLPEEISNTRMMKASSCRSSNFIVKREDSPFYFKHTHPFFRRIEQIFARCLRYSNVNLLQRARRIIPILALEAKAQTEFRLLQIKMKKLAHTENPPVLSIQDVLLVALVSWFKNNFFSWVDSPLCDKCNGTTTFFKSEEKNVTLIKSPYAERVELHRCKSCGAVTRFARYEDLNILLETRQGRCGEFANTFTLLCKAMGWDARIVFDETDHVWTEVYSIAQQRWIHCDPCENVCDRPLMYETGWDKKISYIIAYSDEEVQDVTWRYTSNFEAVRNRRMLCDEGELINVLGKMRQERQRNFSQARRTYLTKRMVLELCEFLQEKTPKEDDHEGRVSGSLLWRMDRGEIQSPTSCTKCVWKINGEKGTAIFRYSAAQDFYESRSGPEGNLNAVVQGWIAGTYKSENIFRKEENDWKQVYLARSKNLQPGSICWCFQLNTAPNIQLTWLTVDFRCALYENGVVRARLKSEDVSQNIEIGVGLRVHKFITNKFAGKSKIYLQAILEGGTGNVAWQHAQLFRQHMDDLESFPFSVEFSFSES